MTSGGPYRSWWREETLNGWRPRAEVARGNWGDRRAEVVQVTRGAEWWRQWNTMVPSLNLTRCSALIYRRSLRKIWASIVHGRISVFRWRHGRRRWVPVVNFSGLWWLIQHSIAEPMLDDTQRCVRMSPPGADLESSDRQSSQNWCSQSKQEALVLYCL